MNFVWRISQLINDYSPGSYPTNRLHKPSQTATCKVGREDTVKEIVISTKAL
jgi:hypothetical protein